MRYADICAGISAATVAWKPLGWRAAFYAEVDKFPSAVLRHHYPDTPNLGDITRFEDWPDASLDVLIGGTPCQGFSVAGLRKGLDDDRSNLALCFGRIAERYQPRWIVWENVPGVRSSGGGRDLGAFLRGLGELGYGLAWRSLDAQYAGLAQRRERLFVVGHLGDWRPAAAVLFEREGLRWDSAPRREAGQRVAPCLESGANRSGGTRPPGSTVDTAETLVAHTLHASCGQACANAVDLETYIPVVSSTGERAHCLNAGGMGRIDYESETLIVHTLPALPASEDGMGRGTPIVPIKTGFQGDSLVTPDGIWPCLPCQGGNNGGGPGAILVQPFAFSSKDYGADAGSLAPTLRAMGHDGSHANAGGQVAVAFQPRFARNGRGAPQEELAYPLTAEAGRTGKGDSAQAVAFTVSEMANGFAWESEVHGALTAKLPSDTSNIQQGVRQGWAVRRLTPTECERLQGFPDGYTDIPWRGKPNAPDGPRYKALGNSIAVPCLRWIGERIELCEDVMRSMKVAA